MTNKHLIENVEMDKYGYYNPKKSWLLWRDG